MFRPSVAAFYPLARCVFYWVGGFPFVKFIVVLRPPSGRSEVKKIAYRMSEILLAAEVTFGGLHRCGRADQIPRTELR
jgi:hypothetical protein